MKFTHLKSTFVICAISFIHACAFAAQVRVPLQPVKNLQAKLPLKKMCAALSTPCKLSTTQIYRDPESPKAYVWLTDESKLMEAKLAVDQPQPQVHIEMDFKGYVHSALFWNPTMSLW